MGSFSYKSVWFICEEGRLPVDVIAKANLQGCVCGSAGTVLTWHLQSTQFDVQHNINQAWWLVTEIQTFVGESEPERSEVQGHLCLHSESEDSLENMSPCLNITLNKTKLRSKLESIHMITKKAILLYHCKTNRKHIYFIPQRNLLQ